ncbi:Conserved_hypothetical protein [Hexamita inflata]|uniref:Uncharacterized protein n=1 Tax=Hexamita inflata TaxID=28002 RepID=A0AA86TCS5_9EUKA|nr:Conserved hypothetical protein [Hexamita inflata]
MQTIKDQIALMRQTETPGQWVIAVQTPSGLAFQGQGSNGFNEFRHFLLPDIVAHIYYLVDKLQLPMLHQKYLCRALMITWIGSESKVPIIDICKLTSSLAFQDTFSPVFASVFGRDVTKVQMAVQDILGPQLPHPSFKNLLEPLQNGFIVYTAKEKRQRPQIVTMVSQKQVKKLLTVSTSPNQLSPVQRSSLQRVNQPLVRQNPKLSQEVVKMQENLQRLEMSQPNAFRDELSDTLEENDIALIQSFVASMGIPKSKVLPKPMSSSTDGTFLTQLKPPSQKSGLNAERIKQDQQKKLEVEQQKKHQEQEKLKQQLLEKQKQQQQEKQNLLDLEKQQQIEKEAQKTKQTQQKLMTQTSLLETIQHKFTEQKMTQTNQFLVKSIHQMNDKPSPDNAKAVKQCLNKAAMAFLILESGKRGVMKKDFNQTLVAVKEFLPANADQVLKRLIQGANADISVDETVSQVDEWVTFLAKYLGI